MDQPKVWKSRGHRGSPSYSFKYGSFGLSKTTFENLNPTDFEKAVERIVKQVFECQIKPQIVSIRNELRILVKLSCI